MKYRIKILLLAAIFIVPALSQAAIPKFLLNQTPVYKFNKQDELQSPPTYQPTIKRNYNVTDYLLDFDWYDMLKEGTKKWSGISTMHLVVLVDTLTQFELDAGELNIEKIEYLGDTLSFKHDKEFQKLYIQSPKKFNKGDKAEITIYFNDTSFDNAGIKYYVKNNTSIKETIAYTMSEPKDARQWFPCSDIPYDRAKSEVKIKVPAGYLAVSNGELLDSATKDTVAYFHWKNNFEMPTYLYAITASKFYSYSDTVKLASGRVLDMPYFFWKQLLPKDSTKLTVLGYTENMMRYYSDIFFEYPYEKYGVVFVPSFLGGMEHTSLITVDNNWINNQYGGLAHEMAHQWLGDYITCADWQDLWINEGGAVWATALWLGHRFGENRFKSEILTNANGFLNNYNNLPAIYNLPDESLFNWQLTYAKSGMVYQMMSEIVGQEKFLKTLRKIFTAYPLTSITTEQFRDIVKQENPEYPLSWDKFFEQWLLMRGCPIYDVKIDYSKLNENSNSIILKIKIKQTQTGNNIPDVFEMPIPIRYVDYDAQIPKNQAFRKYYMKEREQEFTDTLDFMPNFAEIELVKLLHKGAVKLSSIDADRQANTIIYPNIASRGDIVHINIGEPITGFVEIQLFNEIGEQIQYQNLRDNFNIFIMNIPSDIPMGIYYAQINYNGKSEIRKIIIK